MKKLLLLCLTGLMWLMGNVRVMAQGSAFVATPQRTVFLPGEVRNISFVDGKFRCLASGVMFTLQRNGEQLTGFWPDTTYARLEENVEYVVRQPVTGNIFFTSRDKNGHSFLYHCSHFGKKGEKVKMVKMGGGLFSKGMVVEHPTFSSDGRIIIFSSKDEKHPRKGYDLWYSLFDGNEWSDPQNLGQRINTLGHEITPFIYGDYLLFSSNGHSEEDNHLSLYSTRLVSRGVNGDTIDKIHTGRCSIQRLPVPLNADKDDDFGLAIDTVSSCGYWISCRSTTGSDGLIYSFSGTIDGVLLWGRVTDKLGNALPGVTVTTRQGKKNVCTATTDQNGQYRIYLMCDQQYRLAFQLDNHFIAHDSINTAKKDNEYLITETRHDVTLNRLPIGRRIFFEDLFGPDADVELSPRGIEILTPLVQFLNDNPNLTVDMTLFNDLTGNREFNMMLTDERIRTLENYLYPLLPPTVEISIENGCIGHDGCSNASGASHLTVLINN